MLKKIIFFFLVFNINYLLAQNAFIVGEQLKKLDLVEKKASFEKKDTAIAYYRLVLLEKVLDHVFDKYDNMAINESEIKAIKQKQSKGDTLFKYELEVLAKAKPINLNDTCRRLIQTLSRHKVISEKVKKQIEVLHHQGHNNPADLLNAMVYFSSYEYLMQPKNLTYIIEHFHEDKILTDEAKEHLLTQIKDNPKFEYQDIYKAYQGFWRLNIPAIKTEKALCAYLSDFINKILNKSQIIDSQIITEKDSIFDYIYDDTRDSSVWGLYEVNLHKFFTFKYENQFYKYPINIYVTEDSTFDLSSILRSDYFATVLTQITADAKLHFYPVVFNVADDVKHVSHSDYWRYMDRVIKSDKLNQYAVWCLPKQGISRFLYWLPDGRTIDPKGLNFLDKIVCTADKSKLIEEAERMGFFDRLTPKEIKEYKQKVLTSLIDGNYSVISEIPNLVFSEDAMDCSQINSIQDNETDIAKNYERFLLNIVNNYLKNEIIIKKISVNNTQVKNKTLFDIDTEKAHYHTEGEWHDDACELVFPILMDICEKENTPHKIYMNKVFKRNIFFVTDRQAAFLNKKYNMGISKIYK